MNIFRYEFRTRLLWSLWFLVGMVGMVGALLAFYPAFSEDVSSFLEYLQAFPPQFQEAMGLKGLTSFSFPAYLAFSLLYIQLIGTIMAMHLGMEVTSREERERTGEFLLTRPVSRWSILSAKILASGALLLLTDLLFLGALAAITGMLGEEALLGEGVFWLALGTLPLLQLLYFSAGFLSGSFLGRFPSTLPLTLGVVLGTFLLGALRGGDAWMSYLSPFQYFPLQDLIQGEPYSLPHLLTAAAIILGGMGTGAWHFLTKDFETP